MRYTCQTSPRFSKKPFFNIHPMTQSVFVIIGMSMTGVSAHAATSEAANGEAESTLPSLTFTTTATKTPTLVKNTIAQTTVIDEEQLQRYRGQSVLDVLRGKAGFQIKQYGGDGSASNFYLRGYDSKSILVLIDGIRYSSVSYGGANLNLIPADQIDRIEILYGASGASLYGADAMGGVIQLFTKGQNAQQSNVALTIGGGTQNSYKGQITGQYVNDTSTLSLSAGYEKTDGIDATNTNAGFTHYPDRDGFESKNASFVTKHQLNDSISLGLTGLYAKSTTDYDSSDVDYNVSPPVLKSKFVNTYADYENGAINGFINFEKDKLSANLKYGQSFDKSTSYDATTPNGGVFDTTQNQLNFQLGYQLPIGQIIAGYEHLDQNLDVSDKESYKITDRNIDSGFVGYQLANDNYDFQANIRHDRNSQFGNETTYNLGGAYRILPDTRMGASYATGFRAPTFNDLYGHAEGSYPYEGNPNLKAETSKNWEAFIENSNQYHKTRLTGFQSKLNDGLFYQYNFQAPSTTVNKSEAKIKGINLTSDWQVNHILFGIDYTNQRIESKNTGEVFKEDNNQPENKGIIYVGYQHPTFDIRLENQYVGDTKLDSYNLLNLTGNYYLSPNLTINSRLNNLTDKDYETVYGYRQKGINSFVSLTYQWF